MPPSYRILRTGGIIAFGVVALLSAAFFGITLRNRLADEVVPGIYRSSQPTSERLQAFFETLDVTTVVNLRGANPEAEWYAREKETCDRNGVELIDIHFRTFTPPPRIETLRLIDTLDNIRGAAILHCERGADRTGWASGIATILDGGSLSDARGELSALHGHLCDRRSCSYHKFWAQYERWLHSQGTSHTVASFRRWVAQEYAPGKYGARVQLQQPARRIVVEPGGRVSIAVRFENRSPERWVDRGSPESGVRPGARLLGPFEERPSASVEEFRRPFSAARDVFRDARSRVVEPGESIESVVAFAAPQDDGFYLLHIDLVDELVAWFSDFGDPGVIVELQVATQ